MPEEALSGQNVSYCWQMYHDVLVTHIEKDEENRGIDTEYGECLTYGQVTLPVDQGTFVVIRREGYWLVVDTI